MKTKTILLTLGGATIFAATVFSDAQYKAVGDDGIAASPKMRQILNERLAVACFCPEMSSSTDASYKAVGDDGIAASPKLRAMLNERQAAVGGVGTGMETSTGVGYKVIGDDGVAASPKMRQILNQQKPTVETAPAFDSDLDEPPTD